MESMEAARQAVTRGIAVLDQHGPKDWRSRIDVEALDMQDGHWCVAAQIYRESLRQMTAEHRAHQPGDVCAHVLAVQPFDHALDVLRTAVGCAEQRHPGFFDFPREHGFVDFYEVIEGDDDDRDVYVSYETLGDAWKQALSA